MRVKIKFKSPMMKNGQIREIGDVLELDATQAVLLQKKGIVDIPGFKIQEETKEIKVDTLVPEETN